MAAAKKADFLVEIGTEELPPKALKNLMIAFAGSLERLLIDNRLPHGSIRPFASPRRLAAIVSDLALAQGAREIDAKGPPVKVAFDDDGNAKPAAHAFAKKHGVEVDALQRTRSDKGEWLSYRSTEPGLSAAGLLPGIVEQALQALPVPRRMRWGSSDIEFVRPVHWIAMLHGKKVVHGNVMGHTAGNVTHGHRFMSKGELTIDEPAQYESLLLEKGCVIADFLVRQQKITDQVIAAAKLAGGVVVAGDELFEEVTALTEWPVALIGRFDKDFLDLPREVIAASLTGHQRYFPVADKSGQLLPAFIVVANLESRNPDVVREGNERVIRPRLADAAFFWETDRKTPLGSRREPLAKVVYQKGLGSLLNKSERVERLCAVLAKQLGVAAESAMRAAQLSKCDLLTGMVGEFPELQGAMGRYYAEADGETGAVSGAIGDQYLPRFAGDRLPAAVDGQILALADKLDTLAGVFAIGKKPSGNKDPFGLRRAALGVIRILIECRLEVNLFDAVCDAVSIQPVETIVAADVSGQMYTFIAERLRSFYVDQPDISAEVFDSVYNVEGRPSFTLPDFDKRILAVVAFLGMDESASLAAANKRISNILQQATITLNAKVDETLLIEAAEKDLFAALSSVMEDVQAYQASREYEVVLSRLARLKDPVDRFFDEVMVMADDDNLKKNRLTLLANLRAPFHTVADISRLSSAKNQG